MAQQKLVNQPNNYQWLSILKYSLVFYSYKNNRNRPQVKNTINFSYLDRIWICNPNQLKIQYFTKDSMNRLRLIKEAINNVNYTKIEVERKQEVATIWMNSPKDLNSLSQEMMRNIATAITELNNEKAVKIIIIRSRLEKIFCAGADIKEFQTRDLNSYPQSASFRRQHHKPVVAIVQGKALGGGFELALQCDIILCSEKAQFGLPQITLGLIPGMGGTQVLSRIVGEKVAKRMILTGLPIDAKEAHRLNVAHLLPGENFEQAATEIITAMAAKSADALIAGTRAVRASQETSLEQGLEEEASIFSWVFGKKGAKEGISAFVQKRKPNFKGI